MIFDCPLSCLGQWWIKRKKKMKIEVPAQVTGSCFAKSLIVFGPLLYTIHKDWITLEILLFVPGLNVYIDFVGSTGRVFWQHRWNCWRHRRSLRSPYFKVCHYSKLKFWTFVLWIRIDAVLRKKKVGGSRLSARDSAKWSRTNAILDHLQHCCWECLFRECKLPQLCHQAQHRLPSTLSYLLPQKS